jgi:hypothetical protein
MGVAELVQTLSAFYGTQRAAPLLQKSATGLYSEPYKHSLHIPTLFL